MRGFAVRRRSRKITCMRKTMVAAVAVVGTCFLCAPVYADPPLECAIKIGELAIDLGAVPIPITSVAGFPNGRTPPYGDLPPNAIDHDITTFTWTTNPYNIASPSHLAIGFAATPVNRVRLWKESNGGGGENSKNLTIQYTTTDPSVPLASRTWSTVTNLVNGCSGGSELLHATSVNPGGTVTRDVHNSPTGDGWATLTFDTVTATGLRISFSNPDSPLPPCTGLITGSCNHYRVGEFEAYSPLVHIPAP